MSLVKTILLVSAFLVLNTACEADRCFKKVGDLTEKKVEFESFSAIDINGVFNVELVQDTAYYIEATAFEQVMDGIEFELKKDTLACYNYNHCFWRRDFDRPLIRIHFADIKTLDVYESSYIFSTDSISDSFNFVVRSSVAEADLTFNCESVFFYINKTCGGVYVFRGKTNSAFFESFNTGLFKMENLECKKAQVLNFSVIDMKVNVVDELEVGIYNSGNILYKGSPEIIIDSLSSSGRPIPLD